VDDVLDETQSQESLGKTAGKDRERRKATYPASHGLEESKQIVRHLTEQARKAVQPLGAKGALLVEISEFLETRNS
jgi:geranylgeranyl diphosphate synthase type II